MIAFSITLQGQGNDDLAVLGGLLQSAANAGLATVPVTQPQAEAAPPAAEPAKPKKEPAKPKKEKAKEETAPTVETPKPEVAVDESASVTGEEVRAAALAYSKKHGAEGAAKMIEVLKEVGGAPKIKDIEPDKFPALLAAFNAE